MTDKSHLKPITLSAARGLLDDSLPHAEPPGRLVKHCLLCPGGSHSTSGGGSRRSIYSEFPEDNTDAASPRSLHGDELVYCTHYIVSSPVYDFLLKCQDLEISGFALEISQIFSNTKHPIPGDQIDGFLPLKDMH